MIIMQIRPYPTRNSFETDHNIEVAISNAEKLYLKGDYFGAIRECENAISQLNKINRNEITPKHVENYHRTYIAKMNSHLKRGEYDKIDDVCNEALRLEPDNNEKKAQYYFIKSLVTFRQGELDAASAYFDYAKGIGSPELSAKYKDLKTELENVEAANLEAEKEWPSVEVVPEKAAAPTNAGVKKKSGGRKRKVATSLETETAEEPVRLDEKRIGEIVRTYRRSYIPNEEQAKNEAKKFVDMDLEALKYGGIFIFEFPVENENNVDGNKQVAQAFRKAILEECDARKIEIDEAQIVVKVLIPSAYIGGLVDRYRNTAKDYSMHKLKAEIARFIDKGSERGRREEAQRALAGCEDKEDIYNWMLVYADTLNFEYEKRVGTGIEKAFEGMRAGAPNWEGEKRDAKKGESPINTSKAVAGLEPPKKGEPVGTVPSEIQGATFGEKISRIVENAQKSVEDGDEFLFVVSGPESFLSYHAEIAINAIENGNADTLTIALPKGGNSLGRITEFKRNISEQVLMGGVEAGVGTIRSEKIDGEEVHVFDIKKK